MAAAAEVESAPKDLENPVLRDNLDVIKGEDHKRHSSRRKLSVFAAPGADISSIDGIVKSTAYHTTESPRQTGQPESDTRILSSSVSRTIGKVDAPVARSGAAPRKRRESIVTGDEGHPFKSFCTVTHTGFIPFNRSKVNQDRAIQIANFTGDQTQAVFGVFDGHGLEGELCSQFIVDHLEEFLLKECDGDFSSQPAENFNRGFFELQTKMKEDTSINTQYSGTTCVVSYFVDGKIFTANVGDSRTIIGRQKRAGNKIESLALSTDQKPEDTTEKRRIIKAGGRVEACYDQISHRYVGPKRVWLKKRQIPGLAMSRSFGDDVAHSVGVVADPVVEVHKIKDRDKCVILATDGIYEFLSNDQVVNMAMKSDNAEDACNAICDASKKMWEEEEEVIDDMTVTVIFL